MPKMFCLKCLWRGWEPVEAQNPFDEGPEKCWACPDCKSVDMIILACDEPGCWKAAVGDNPTCYEHSQAARLCARLESEAEGYRSLQAYHDADCALAARLIRRAYGEELAGEKP